jgi:hypothetical protein
MYLVQSVILHRDKFTKPEAYDWVRKHDYSVRYGVDVTPEYYRFRQVPPERLHGFRIRSIALGDDGYILVAYQEAQK